LLIRHQLAVLFSQTNALFVWLISHQPTVLFSQNKSAITNQPAVLSSQNKAAPAISHQPNEQAANQLPAISQYYFFLRINQHQPSVTSQLNRPQ
jgi:hypothetical protein